MTDVTKKAFNALTIDVEDGWWIFSRDWLHKEIEPTEIVVKDTEKILNILADKGVYGTFFIVGIVAQKFPSLIKRISNAGHELGIHGFSHKQVFRLTQEEFREDIVKAKKTVEDITSAPVYGHRAAAFSVSPQTKWALRILAEEGFIYDSSIAPCNNPNYGWNGFSKDICRIDIDNELNMIEFPMSIWTIPMTNKGFMTGGGYLRRFPYFVSCAVIKHIQKIRPVVVYMHPYEFGSDTVHLPMEHLSSFSRLKARLSNCWYLGTGIGNRSSMPAKLHKLLSTFEFTTAKNVIDKWFEHI